MGSSQRPLPGNTQHSQQKDIYSASRIRTCNPSRQTAADARLRPRGHRDRHVSYFQCKAVLILKCGTSLCVTIRNRNNLAQGTEFLHWQSALFTNKQAVDCVQQGTKVTYNRLDTKLKNSQFFHHHPKMMRQHSEAMNAIPLARPLVADVILFAHGPTAVQSTNFSG